MRPARAQGAGIVECDVTFTRDGELVCRHAECDLHTTTNIVATPLNNKCTRALDRGRPGAEVLHQRHHAGGVQGSHGKMDASNPAATTAEGFLGGTACVAHGPVHRSTGGNVRDAEGAHRARQAMGGQAHARAEGAATRSAHQAVFGGQAQYAQGMIDTYKARRRRSAGGLGAVVRQQRHPVLDPRRAAFGRQAVYLDDIDPTANPPIPRIYADGAAAAEGRRRAASSRRRFRAARRRRGRADRALAVRAGHQGHRLRRSSPGRFERADLRKGAAGRPASTTYFDPNGRGASGRTATCTRRWTRWRSRSGVDRNLLGLAGDGHLLRQLHGTGVLRAVCQRPQPVVGLGAAGKTQARASAAAAGEAPWPARATSAGSRYSFSCQLL